MNYQDYLSITPEIKEALESGKPVVALESTILAHGMPYPENVEFASKVEEIIRAEGAIPATIAIMDGKVKVGLNSDELFRMCSDKEVIKASRRDMAYLLATKKIAATTVTTTMIGAAMAGIKVFATGGIGGVHRGAAETMDISADLQEFAHTDVLVVSAGCKSILDIGLTLEYLETMGVPVLGYGTTEMPAFYCDTSGYKVDYQVDTPEEVANIMKTKWDLGLNGGILLANPIPHEYSMDHEYIDAAIDKAVEMAKEQGIKGKATTPFLLATIKDLTGGSSFDSNKELAYNNARVAAKVAYAYSKIA
ncbi:MAG: pseudouridine-5'-phosphate glycosidase [Erysipelotrichaceae bacterium]|nr:pseudouridine-5'-phosphate glycosidase [Erysipelotrichaceae bacterium]